MKPSTSSKLLHVLIGEQCNNNCIFCMEDNLVVRRDYVSSIKDDDIKKMIFDTKGVKEILFTSGEPTLNRSLPRYINWAREAGIPTIALITNGRRLSYTKYSAALIQLGLNKITVSIHGPTAKIHDALTRTPGAFEQTVKGLDNLKKLKKKHQFSIETSTVLTKWNLSSLFEMYEKIYKPMTVDKIVFNVMMALGRAKKQLHRLMPSYSEITKTLLIFFGSIPKNDIRKFAVIDIPYCTITPLPEIVKGFPENYKHYEPITSTGNEGIEQKGRSIEGIIKTLKKISNGLIDIRQKKLINRHKNKDYKLLNQKSLEGEQAYYLTERNFKEKFFRVKRSACNQCILNDTCPGIWEEYVKLFGWSEFIPVE